MEKSEQLTLAYELNGPLIAGGRGTLAIKGAIGEYDLRLRIYCENGQFKKFSFQYTVDRFRRPDANSLKPAN